VSQNKIFLVKKTPLNTGGRGEDNDCTVKTQTHIKGEGGEQEKEGEGGMRWIRKK
jgi:hypothetical protein